MIRESFVSIYLLLFKAFFYFFKLFPQHNKTVCVASFGDNIFYTARALSSISTERIIVLKDPRCKYRFDLSIVEVIQFKAWYPISYIRSIYHLATATSVLVDNYFGFLGVTNFRKGTTCLQLWHAAGALKQFGLMDPSVEARSSKAQERFQKVYNRFDYTIVGSERMANVFRKSFGLEDEAIIRTGIPRTDIFFNPEEKHTVEQKFQERYPLIKNKKVILYAPTYRDHQLKNYQLVLKIDELYKELANEYVLFIKQHPAVSYKFSEKYDEFVYDLSYYYDTNHLLQITDILITDYSSIPFEYSLLGKPMIFYAYDIEDYEKTRGLLGDYQSEMPGPIVFTTDAIIQKIKEDSFDDDKIKSFAIKWNEYSKGNSSMNVASFLTDKEEES